MLYNCYYFYFIMMLIFTIIIICSVSFSSQLKTVTTEELQIQHCHDVIPSAQE